MVEWPSAKYSPAFVCIHITRQERGEGTAVRSLCPWTGAYRTKTGAGCVG
jgi:hypothetical protein